MTIVNNNIVNDFYNSVFKVGSNPFVLVILIIIIFIYYALFSSLGKESGSDYSGNERNGFVSFFEALLWALLILLIFFNGVSYFFNINVTTELKNLFSNEPQIDIKSTTHRKYVPHNPEPVTKKEVYHVPGNRFTYNDAKAVCKAFDGEMASYEQIKKAQSNGASWCSYGWTQDQLALYPTSQSDFNKLKNKEGHEYDCGLPGVNGGYVPNTHLHLGANCYGVKPKKSDLEEYYFDEDNKTYPKTLKEQIFDKRVEYWKDRIGNILVAPFNNDKWFKI